MARAARPLSAHTNPTGWPTGRDPTRPGPATRGCPTAHPGRDGQHGWVIDPGRCGGPETSAAAARLPAPYRHTGAGPATDRCNAASTRRGGRRPLAAERQASTGAPARRCRADPVGASGRWRAVHVLSAAADPDIGAAGWAPVGLPRVGRVADRTCRWAVGGCEHGHHRRKPHPPTNSPPERSGDSPAVDPDRKSGRMADPVGLRELVAAGAIDFIPGDPPVPASTCRTADRRPKLSDCRRSWRPAARQIPGATLRHSRACSGRLPSRPEPAASRT